MKQMMRHRCAAIRNCELAQSALTGLSERPSLDDVLLIKVESHQTLAVI